MQCKKAKNKYFLNFLFHNGFYPNDQGVKKIFDFSRLEIVLHTQYCTLLVVLCAYSGPN